MKNALIVGPCSADVKALKKVLESKYSLNVDEAKTLSSAKSAIESNYFDILLVSRIIQSDRSSGIDLLNASKSLSPKTKVFFLSRFPEAQEEAINSGADAAFDMDLLIGYIRPSMIQKYKDISSKLSNF